MIYCIKKGEIFYGTIKKIIFYYHADRYDFVKMHYFTPEDLASFPNEIPEDATNIILSYNGEIFNNSRKSLLLEFDSNTITSNNHHASFYSEVEQ